MVEGSSVRAGGNMPTEPPTDPDVLAAMMDDLGLTRVEELARDVNDGGLVQKSRGAAQTRVLQPMDPSNELAKMYRDAIEQGLFKDEDYREVQHLDPLDGGNAHRLHRSDQPDHGRERRHHGREDHRPSKDSNSRNDTTGSMHRPRTYDPFKSRRLRHPPNQEKAGPGVSSLGGVIPPGGKVKRWDHKKAKAVISDNPGHGRGSPIKGQNRKTGVPGPSNVAASFTPPHLRVEPKTKTQQQKLAPTSPEADRIPMQSQVAPIKPPEEKQEEPPAGSQSMANFLIDFNESLIDFDNHPPSSQGRSYHEDLVGLQYDVPATETPKRWDKPVSTQPKGDQRELIPAYCAICPDFASIDAYPLGKDLSKKSLSILSRATTEEYHSMISTCDNLATVISTAISGPRDERMIKFAAAQIASMHLARDAEFRALPDSDKNKTIAVVYRNILDGRSSALIRLPQYFLDLRSSATSCPQEIREINAIIAHYIRQQEIADRERPLVQQAPYDSSIFEKHAADNDEFLYGKKEQVDSRSNSQQTTTPSKGAELAGTIHDSFSEDPWDLPIPQPSPRTSQLSPEQRPSEEYITSNLPTAGQLPQVASHVPRVIPQPAQSRPVRKGLAASRWSDPDPSPSQNAQAPSHLRQSEFHVSDDENAVHITRYLASHQQSDSNVSTRSTMSRLAKELALLRVNDRRRS